MSSLPSPKACTGILSFRFGLEASLQGEASVFQMNFQKPNKRYVSSQRPRYTVFRPTISSRFIRASVTWTNRPPRSFGGRFKPRYIPAYRDLLVGPENLTCGFIVRSARVRARDNLPVSYRSVPAFWQAMEQAYALLSFIEAPEGSLRQGKDRTNTAFNAGGPFHFPDSATSVFPGNKINTEHRFSVEIP